MPSFRQQLTLHLTLRKVVGGGNRAPSFYSLPRIIPAIPGRDGEARNGEVGTAEDVKP